MKRQALGKLQVLPEQHRAQPGGTGNFCLWLLFLHFQLVLSSCVQHTPHSAQKVALGRGGDSKQNKSAGIP